MENIVILGAGAIGSYLINKWDKQANLYILDFSPSSLIPYQNHHTLCLDISHPQEKLVSFLPKKIDKIVHTCGYMGEYSLLHEENPSQMELIMQSTVYTLYYVLQIALPRMKNGGRIAVISSSNALNASSKLASYTMAHHALCGLVKSVAIDYAMENIYINALLPSAIHSPCYLKCQSQHTTFHSQKQLLGSSVLSLEEVYQALCPLLSASSAMNGALIPLDKGLSCF